MNYNNSHLAAVTLLLFAPLVFAQQPSSPQIGSVATAGVTLRNATAVSGGLALLSNNSEVVAGDRAALVSLQRGGSLLVCQSTSLRMAEDSTLHNAGVQGNQGLLLSLSRGALEAHYTPSAYSDVILTPDMRLLISGPGTADLKVRVNSQGDTCVDNTGEGAPYVIASNLLDGGAYRVRPGQRVQFLQGSLRKVVDSESEPCGCPPETTTDQANKNGGPSSAPSDTAFPTAVSEGLQSPPTQTGPAPVVPNGQVHVQSSAILSDTPPVAPAAAPPKTTPPASALASSTTPSPAPGLDKSATVLSPMNITVQTEQKHGFFAALKHFFGKLFGAGA